MVYLEIFVVMEAMFGLLEYAEVKKLEKENRGIVEAVTRRVFEIYKILHANGIVQCDAKEANLMIVSNIY